MRVELGEWENGYEFSLEPETEVEKCALEHLATRPKDQVIIRNTRLGVFKREDKK